MENNKCCQGCGEIGTVIHCWWKYKMALLWYDPVHMTKQFHSFIHICPKELKMYVHAKTCSWMFIVALFITAKNWKQPKCPLTDGQRKCDIYIYIYIYSNMI